MTKVINIKDAPEDWMNDPQFVYIGRPGNGLRGPFGNPCAVDGRCPVCGEIHKTPGSTLVCYEQYLRTRLMKEWDFNEEFRKLHGKTLVCFCKPGPCHGDVMLEKIEFFAKHPVIGPFRDQYSWLSNFQPVQINYQGRDYPSVEHAYQCAKHFGKPRSEFLRIYEDICSGSAGQAKRKGRSLAKQDSDFNQNKVAYMLELLRLKYQRPDLRLNLQKTGVRWLVEYNEWSDDFWGVCIKKRAGHNHLGWLTMKVRAEIKQENKS